MSKRIFEFFWRAKSCPGTLTSLFSKLLPIQFSFAMRYAKIRRNNSSWYFYWESIQDANVVSLLFCFTSYTQPNTDLVGFTCCLEFAPLPPRTAPSHSLPPPPPWHIVGLFRSCNTICGFICLFLELRAGFKRVPSLFITSINISLTTLFGAGRC